MDNVGLFEYGLENLCPNCPITKIAKSEMDSLKDVQLTSAEKAGSTVVKVVTRLALPVQIDKVAEEINCFAIEKNLPEPSNPMPAIGSREREQYSLTCPAYAEWKVSISNVVKEAPSNAS